MVRNQVKVGLDSIRVKQLHSLAYEAGSGSVSAYIEDIISREWDNRSSEEMGLPDFDFVGIPASESESGKPLVIIAMAGTSPVFLPAEEAKRFVRGMHAVLTHKTGSVGIKSPLEGGAFVFFSRRGRGFSFTLTNGVQAGDTSYERRGLTTRLALDIAKYLEKATRTAMK